MKIGNHMNRHRSARLQARLTQVRLTVLKGKVQGRVQGTEGKADADHPEEGME